jgi:diphosphomevalonate decarboxylase
MGRLSMAANLYTAVVPSNIAFIKYWGKRPGALQWPTNDSISMTLSGIHTTTAAQVLDRGGIDILRWDGGLLADCDPRYRKFAKHLHMLKQETGFEGVLDVSTANSFPTGAGIASSASGFGALTVASLAAMHRMSGWDELTAAFGTQRLAHWARLGSGSACRSLFGGYVRWHAGDQPDRQSCEQIAPADFLELSDIVVICDAKEKAHSSSDGHQLAWTSPLFKLRLAGLPERLDLMENAIRSRDFERMGELLETEALEMHSIMMTSQPSLHYGNAQTWEILGHLRHLRLSKQLQAYFTLDAGPNPHIICRSTEQKMVVEAIRKQYPELTIIVDKIGSGVRLTQAADSSDLVPRRHDLANHPN